MIEKIEPCPFCGDSAVVEIQWVQDTRIYGRKSPWAAHCICCGTTGVKSTDKNEAIRRWNQRAPSKQLTQTQQKLDVAVETLEEIAKHESWDWDSIRCVVDWCKIFTRDAKAALTSIRK